MKRLLRPGLLWPLFVVALLLTSVTTSLYALVAARSDGGVQSVPDYYAQATQYDALSGERVASDALGWQVAVAPQPAGTNGLRELRFEMTDAAGAPVAGLVGEVTIQRPSGVTPTALVPFHAVAAGGYAAALPMDAVGLWDVRIRARRADDRFLQTVRVEVR